jgi:MFS family permease
MSKRQLFLLFISSLIPWTVGNGILPLLPVYASSLGASSSVAGIYLAISYVAITLGALGASWVSDHFHSRRIPLIVVGALAVPLIWLMGQVHNLWQLTAVTASLWFLGGMGFALTSILAGLFAGEDERGKVFGILSLTGPLGLLIGGLASGPIVDRWGYPTMFLAFAIYGLIWPLVALGMQDMTINRSAQAKQTGQSSSTALGWIFWLFFLACLLASIGSFVSNIGRSLVMDNLGFSASAISSTGAIGGLIALPLGLLAGLLSDKIGRKGLLGFGFLSLAVGLGLFIVANSLWHFWLAIALVSTQNAVNGAVGSALVADLISKNLLDRALAFFSSTAWLGGVIGFALAGLAIEGFGFTPTFLVAALLPLISILMLIPIRVPKSTGRMDKTG